VPSLLFTKDPSRKKSKGSGRGRAWVVVIVVVLVAAGAFGALVVFSDSHDGRPDDGESTEIAGAIEVQTPRGTGTSDQRPAEEEENGTDTPPPVSPGEPSPQAELLKAEAIRLERVGKILEARATYAKALAARPNLTQHRAIAVRIEAICRRTILGPTVVPGETEATEYEVQSGDYLSTIGRKYSIPYELVKRINSLSSDRIYAGQKLKVVKGPFHIRIVKSELVLEIWLRNLLVKTYPVAIGKEDRTPAGRYSVGVKLVDPAFSPPPSQRGIMKPVAGGEPDNPLGSRWIGFGKRLNHLGIHGTNDPASIGKRVSLGCIRMKNADVEMVYDFVVPQLSNVPQLSKVEIVESRSR